LAVLILGGLSGVFYQVHSSLTAQKAKQLDNHALVGMLPDAVQWIQNFHRIEIREGRKAWEVEADEAQYLEESQQVLVRNPQASFFLKDGEKVRVKGGQGKLEFSGQDLQKATLHDNVEIHVRDYVVHCQAAVYQRDLDQIVADGPVSIVGDQLQVDGNDMVVFMKDARFELQKQVRVTLLPKFESGHRPS
jgi:LPS export ABC transporter protein LptC